MVCASPVVSHKMTATWSSMYMGCGFTSGEQESGSMFSAAVCKYGLLSATLNPYH